jgi:hypothetical protein
MPVQTSVSDMPSAAFAGLLVGTQHTIIGMRNAHASAEMVPGRGVVFKAGGTTDQDATLPAAETDKLAGIVVHSDVYDRTYTLADGSTAGELGTTGYKVGAMVNVLRRGQIWAVCEDGCAPGDKLWVRAVAGADPEFLGGLNNADDSTDMIDATAVGTWLTTASAGGLAVLSVNLP